MGNKKGQILLITVMLLATVMTVVLSISFKSITETQVTKLEEESQKALAASESAIDVALKENQNVTIGTGSLTSITGFSGGATIDTTTSNTFISPNILKDGSYTFYLGNYNVDNKTIGASSGQDIAICFQSGAVNPAIEITLIKTGGVRKYVVDDPSSSRIINAYDASTICTPNANYGFSYTILGTHIGVDGKFLLVRVLYAPTKLYFYRPSPQLPVQGRTISSQATSSTSTGVSKKVVLFQSHPQIPPEFFTTAF